MRRSLRTEDDEMPLLPPPLLCGWKPSPTVSCQSAKCLLCPPEAWEARAWEKREVPVCPKEPMLDWKKVCRARVAREREARQAWTQN